MIDYKGIITINPGKRFEKPCIRNMRITVYDVLGWLAAGMSRDAIIEDFPELTQDDITACLAYAADKERKIRIACWNCFSIRISLIELQKSFRNHSQTQSILVKLGYWMHQIRKSGSKPGSMVFPLSRSTLIITTWALWKAARPKSFGCVLGMLQPKLLLNFWKKTKNYSQFSFQIPTIKVFRASK